MPDSFTIMTVLPASAESIYHAWLDSDEHSHFTGSPAQIDPTVGGRFTAWDGYISGVTLEMQPHRRIVQAWRTTGFAQGSPDSRVELVLDEVKDGTQLTLIHTNMPDGQGDEYKQGWEDYYFTPMQQYFQPDDIS